LAIDDAKVCQGFLEVSLKALQTSLQKNITWIKKLGKGSQEWKYVLYHCKVVNEDAQNSYEDMICFKRYLVSRNF
jgi:hypothetical protein